MNNDNLHHGSYRDACVNVVLAAAVIIIGASAFPTIAGAGEIVRLPQDHAYQKALRAYMTTLTVKDFTVDPSALENLVSFKDERIAEVIEETKPRSEKDYDALLQIWTMMGDNPRIDEKRCAPSINTPPEYFTIDAIETEEGVCIQHVWAEPITWLANWRHPHNKFYGSKELKLRAFVNTAIDMMMLDHLQETDPTKGANRTDYMAPHLREWAFAYQGIKDALPRSARKAYAEGLTKMCRRVLQWGPKGEETQFEFLAAVGLQYAADAVNDRKLRAEVASYIKALFANEDFYNPAGYFTYQGGFDGNFNGISLYYATWLAMVADDDAITEAVSKAWDLRSHLILPDPDGFLTGPAHFNTRTPSPVAHDGWNWPHRDRSAAMLSDRSAHLFPMPTDEELRKAPAVLLGQLTARYIFHLKWYIQGTKYARPWIAPWKFSVFPNNMNMEMVNYAGAHYRKGYYARRRKKAQEEPAWETLPFKGDGTFVRAFGTSFLVAKKKGFGVIIHTGNVSEPAGKGYYEFPGPYGFGGGALSAFWTPEGGSLLLGIRSGMNYGKNLDLIEDWRLWPTHAVSGVRSDGSVFTSARIRNPAAQYTVDEKKTIVTVNGQLPAATFASGKVLEGRTQMKRVFTITNDGLDVQTSITAGGQDLVSELYEVIPVYGGYGRTQKRKKGPAIGSSIGFRVGETWQKATGEFVANVDAVRVKRFNGGAVITFSRPRRVKLSEKELVLKFISYATCRNVLVDLLENDDNPVILHSADVAYRITPLPIAAK